MTGNCEPRAIFVHAYGWQTIFFLKIDEKTIKETEPFELPTLIFRGYLRERDEAEWIE